jgi:chaperone modulatory protein CbpM
MTEATEVLWLDEHHELSLTTLAELSGLSTAELRHLVECGTLAAVANVEPAAAIDTTEAHFSAQCLALARTASRLRNDFDLDEDALALTLRLLNRIHELETEIRHLRAQGSG